MLYISGFSGYPGRYTLISIHIRRKCSWKQSKQNTTSAIYSSMLFLINIYFLYITKEDLFSLFTFKSLFPNMKTENFHSRITWFELKVWHWKILGRRISKLRKFHSSIFPQTKKIAPFTIALSIWQLLHFRHWPFWNKHSLWSGWWTWPNSDLTGPFTNEMHTHIYNTFNISYVLIQYSSKKNQLLLGQSTWNSYCDCLLIL